MHLATSLRSALRTATRPLSKVLADAGSAMADGDARFWGLADVRALPRPLPTRPLPVPTGARPQEATP